MSSEGSEDLVDDIRWTTLCHHAESLMNTHKMRQFERLSVGTYIVSSVIKAMPREEQFRWLAHVLHEISTQSAGLNVQPVTEKV